jgi:hypothetical protein
MARWKDALANLADVLSLRRLTSRVALSAGLLSLAAHAAPEAAGQPRVPVTPVLAPEAMVRRFRGRYVLRRRAQTYAIHLAGHGSHSSHASHASHSSHYSGSHFSSSSPSPSPAPAPAPAPQPEPTSTAADPLVPQPQPATPRKRASRPAAPSKPAPLLRDSFDDVTRNGNWRLGVLATPPETFDPSLATSQTDGCLTIETAAQRGGIHFSGYVSTAVFNLQTATVTVKLRSAAAGATTLVTAARDAKNWAGFRIEGGQLAMESHTAGKVAARTIAYDAAQHRWLRLRTSSVAPVVVWETSPDGASWNPEYVETAAMPLDALQVALSAGTRGSARTAGAAQFDLVLVEARP